MSLYHCGTLKRAVDKVVSVASDNGSSALSIGVKPSPSTAPVATRIGLSAILTLRSHNLPANTPTLLPCNCGTNTISCAAMPLCNAAVAASNCDHVWVASSMPGVAISAETKRPKVACNVNNLSCIAVSSGAVVMSSQITIVSND